VEHAELWRWSSLWLRLNGSGEHQKLLAGWPVDRGKDWAALVNEPLSDREIGSMQVSMKRGRPLGSPIWTQKIIDRLDLQHTVREEGRPAKAKNEEEEKN
jgi:hypothetical protein